MGPTNGAKNGRRHGSVNNSLMKAKRHLDEAMAQLNDFPKLRDRVGALREELLQAFIDLERSPV